MSRDEESQSNWTKDQWRQLANLAKATKEVVEARIAELEDEKEQLLLRKAQFRKASLLPPDVHDPERWLYLRSLKKADAIGQAFAMLEASILHHEIERDGWTPDDECYMETLVKARELIEADRDRWKALATEIRTKADAEWWESGAANDWLARYDQINAGC